MLPGLVSHPQPLGKWSYYRAQTHNLYETQAITWLQPTTSREPKMLQGFNPQPLGILKTNPKHIHIHTMYITTHTPTHGVQQNTYTYTLCTTQYLHLHMVCPTTHILTHSKTQPIHMSQYNDYTSHMKQYKMYTRTHTTCTQYNMYNMYIAALLHI